MQKVIYDCAPHFPLSFASTSLGQPKKENDPLDALPNELLEKIFKCLTASELARFEKVCQSWKQKTDAVGAWQILFKRDFPWAHRILASLHQTRSNQSQGSITWSRAYRAYSLGQVLWHKEHSLKGHLVARR